LVEAVDVDVFWQVVEEFAGFVFGAHSPEPEAAQGAF
jgi:hypothetical protein